MKATKQIDIYLTQKRNVRLIDVVQYDTGIQLVFTVKDFTIPSGATATLYVQKPSGKFVYQEDKITISGNTITIDLENQAITEHGKIPYQVSLSSGSDVITTFTGLMMVEKSLKDAGATESRTVIRAFEEAADEQIERILNAHNLLAAKNEAANAVKGYLSGAVVAADDVSPVEHDLKVSVSGVGDPTKVTVTRYGKNLQKNDSSTQTINGVTFTVNSDGSVTANGTATSDARFLIYKRVPIKGVAKCILNGAPSGASETTYFLHTVMAWGGVDHSFYDYGNGREFDVGGTITASTVSITVKSGVTVSGLVFRPMIRLASISDGSFEPYTEQTAIPAADGTVSGMTSLSPCMTILTDTEGVIVECEYNRDTNKVIDKLINAITALGGTV